MGSCAAGGRENPCGDGGSWGKRAAGSYLHVGQLKTTGASTAGHKCCSAGRVLELSDGWGHPVLPSQGAGMHGILLIPGVTAPVSPVVPV